MWKDDHGWDHWDDNTCGYCGHKEDEEPPFYLICPVCEREGCDDCMPMGRGCACPDCEDE